ncbi:MAG: hypothetical protein CL694_13465 [Chloroflexi bacterium]|nr:hypothetical protein [Chloroflexota bacterium]HAL49072.1 hypothetical protein [Dehalococcoidia bacterium]
MTVAPTNTWAILQESESAPISRPERRSVILNVVKDLGPRRGQHVLPAVSCALKPSANGRIVRLGIDRLTQRTK